MKRPKRSPLRRRSTNDAFYLEYPCKVVKTDFAVVGCSCRSRFCKRCGISRGLDLRHRVVNWSVAMDWRNPQMWTFSIDPELFDSPEAAYLHVRESRVFSLLMRELRRQGHVDSPEYFVVLEFQKNGWPHWHLLLDGAFVPWSRVVQLWNRHVPEGRVASRCGLGSVFYTKKGKFKSAENAVNYVTKYVIKNPQEGWPDWLLDSRHNVPRYSASRGFFLDGRPANEKDPDNESASADLSVSERPTIRQRVAACKFKAVMMRYDWISNANMSYRRSTFMGSTALPRHVLAGQLGVDLEAIRFSCPPDRVAEFLGMGKHGSLKDGDESIRNPSCYRHRVNHDDN